jgi:hypothetical protein
LNSHPKVFAVVCAMALLVPAGATAKRPEGKPEKGKPEHGNVEKGNKPGKPETTRRAKNPKVKLATANIKGVVDSNDGSAMTVTVSKASGHVKACKGAALTFDVSSARVHTADNDADGDADAADVLVGHAVKVRTKVARVKGKKTTCVALEGDTLVAKAIHNRTTPEAEDDAEETDEGVDEDEQELDEDDDVEDEEELETS